MPDSPDQPQYDSDPQGTPAAPIFEAESEPVIGKEPTVALPDFPKLPDIDADPGEPMSDEMLEEVRAAASRLLDRGIVTMSRAARTDIGGSLVMRTSSQLSTAAQSEHSAQLFAREDEIFVNLASAHIEGDERVIATIYNRTKLARELDRVKLPPGDPNQLILEYYKGLLQRPTNTGTEHETHEAVGLEGQIEASNLSVSIDTIQSDVLPLVRHDYGLGVDEDRRVLMTWLKSDDPDFQAQAEVPSLAVLYQDGNPDGVNIKLSISFGGEVDLDVHRQRLEDLPPTFNLDEVRQKLAADREARDQVPTAMKAKITIDVLNWLEAVAQQREAA